MHPRLNLVSKNQKKKNPSTTLCLLKKEYPVYHSVIKKRKDSLRSVRLITRATAPSKKKIEKEKKERQKEGTRSRRMTNLISKIFSYISLMEYDNRSRIKFFCICRTSSSDSKSLFVLFEKKKRNQSLIQ